MSAARDLAKLGNTNTLKVDTISSKVGINSTIPIGPGWQFNVFRCVFEGRYHEVSIIVVNNARRQRGRIAKLFNFTK